MEYAMQRMTMRSGNAPYSADPVDFGRRATWSAGLSRGASSRPERLRARITGTAAVLSGWIANVAWWLLPGGGCRRHHDR
jgi:hypothetical protein